MGGQVADKDEEEDGGQHRTLSDRGFQLDCLRSELAHSDTRRSLS